MYEKYIHYETPCSYMHSVLWLEHTGVWAGSPTLCGRAGNSNHRGSDGPGNEKEIFMVETLV